MQLEETHPQLVSRLGVVFTKKLAVTTEVLELGRFALSSGISLQKVSELLENMAKRHYYTTRHQYVGDQLAWKSIGSQGGIHGRRGVSERFSSFEDRSGFAGKYPKAQWLVRKAFPKCTNELCRFFITNKFTIYLTHEYSFT